MDTTFLKARLDETIGRAIDAGEWPCALALVFDGEREFYEGAFGRTDLARPGAPDRDTIFRMFSSTKPFTGFAAAICVERGLLSLEDRVERFLPGFADVRVGKRAVIALHQTVQIYLHKHAVRIGHVVQKKQIVDRRHLAPRRFGRKTDIHSRIIARL